MIFGEELHYPERLLRHLDKAKAKYEIAPWAEVALVREGVGLLIAYEVGFPKLRMLSGEIQRDMLWYRLVSGGRQRPRERMPKQDGPLYVFGEHPGEAMVVMDARVARGLDYTGFDLYFTPVEKRSWVWINTHDPLGPFFGGESRDALMQAHRKSEGRWVGTSGRVAALCVGVSSNTR